jgi:uncharacterized protein
MQKSSPSRPGHDALFSAEQQARLTAALAGNVDTGLNFGEAAGFLFALICSPRMIPPSEWIATIVGEHGFADKNEDQARQLFGDLMALNNWIVERRERHECPLPPGFDLLPDPMDNFAADAPIHQWATGFTAGHGMTESIWNEVCDDDEDLGLALMSLAFFTSTRFAEEICAEAFDGDRKLEAVTATVCKLLPDAFHVYAAAGRAGQLELSQRQSEPARSTKIGRNEPCPCGSGRKYKKCCGAPGGTETQRVH